MIKHLRCGQCHNVRYCDPLSEWYCAKYHTFLGYNMRPLKCFECNVIGINGDTKHFQALWELLY